MFPTITTLVFSILSVTTGQTPCTDEQAYQTKGRWKKESDEVALADRTFPKAQHKVVLTKADRIVKLLKDALPELTGIDAKVYRSIRGDPYAKDGAVKFGVNSLYLSYYCVPNKGYADSIRGTVQPGGETGTWIYFTFNGLDWLANERMTVEGLKTVKGSSILYLPKRIGEWRGFELLKPSIHAGKRDEEAIVIAPDGRSPYKPLTREQYIRARIARKQDELATREKDHEKLMAGREESIAKIDTWKMSDEVKAKERENMSKRYDGWAAQHATFKEKTATELAAFERAIEELSPEDREARAVIKSAYAMPPAEKLFAGEAEGGRALATIDRSLFDAQSPRDMIRMITIYWTWDTDIPTKVALIKRFKEHFDFGAAKEMIGQ